MQYIGMAGKIKYVRFHCKDNICMLCVCVCVYVSFRLVEF